MARFPAVRPVVPSDYTPSGQSLSTEVALPHLTPDINYKGFHPLRAPEQPKPEATPGQTALGEHLPHAEETGGLGRRATEEGSADTVFTVAHLGYRHDQEPGPLTQPTLQRKVTAGNTTSPYGSTDGSNPYSTPTGPPTSYKPGHNPTIPPWADHQIYQLFSPPWADKTTSP